MKKFRSFLAEANLQKGSPRGVRWDRRVQTTTVELAAEMANLDLDEVIHHLEEDGVVETDDVIIEPND